MLNFIKNISPTEITILVIIFILLFGAKTFISLGKAGGSTLKEIKNIKKTLTERQSIETLLKVMAWNSAPSFCKNLRITMLATRADFGAAGQGIPSGFCPLDS